MSSMFIARDQENLVHAQQQAAASKPLNQGIKQFAPKTPGQLPKTPFRRGLNDENDVGLFAGKGAIRGAKNGGENTVLRTVKPGKQDFVTPMVPKTKERAPLGMKTTNAKARAFQTPGQVSKPLGNVNGTNKVNRSLRRPTSLRKKQTPPVKPQQQQPQQTTQKEVKQQLQPSLQEDIPEPEYAPPTPEALPDPPEPIPYDRTFPQFQGRNFSHRWELLHVDPEKEQQIQQAINEEYDRQIEKKIQQDLDSATVESDGLGDVLPGLKKEEKELAGEGALNENKEKQKKKKKNGGATRIGTRMVTRAMAKQQQLLKEQEKKPAQPQGITRSSTSRPGSSDSKANKPTPLIAITSASPQISLPTPIPKTRSRNPSRMLGSKSLDLTTFQGTPEEIEARHAQAVAGSKTTVGYSMGRSVSTKLSKMKSAEGQIEGGEFKRKLKTVRSVSSSAVNNPVSLKDMFGSPPSNGNSFLNGSVAHSGVGETGVTQGPMTLISKKSFDSAIADDTDSGSDADSDDDSDDDDCDSYEVDDDDDDDGFDIDIEKILRESESDAEFQLTL